MPAPKTWKSLVYEVVQQLPRVFTLADVMAKKEFFQRHYPDNRFVDAKLRQSLQVLRDQGLLLFLGAGRYQRIDGPVKFSPLIDPVTAAQYASKSQATRVMLETWAEMNLYCVNCSADALNRLAANTPVADFACASCEARYQLKSKEGRFGPRLSGAAYEPTVRAIREGSLPEYILVEFDQRFATVVFVDAIPGRFITEDRIVARKPLAPSARRAGWRGCTINVSGLPSARIVEPAGLQSADVREAWRKIKER
jgi:hypothetical protein